MGWDENQLWDGMGWDEISKILGWDGMKFLKFWDGIGWDEIWGLGWDHLGMEKVFFALGWFGISQITSLPTRENQGFAFQKFHKLRLFPHISN